MAEGEDVEEWHTDLWRSLDIDSVLITIIPDAPDRVVEKRAIDLIRAANVIGVDTFVLSNKKSKTLNEAKESIIFPGEISELMSPLVYMVPLYLLTYYVAIVSTRYTLDCCLYLENSGTEIGLFFTKKITKKSLEGCIYEKNKFGNSRIGSLVLCISIS